MWESGIRVGVVRRLAALAVVLLASAAVPSAGDTPVFAEGEDYLNYEWYNIGGFDIGVEWCSGASQGYAAGGLDVAGEWIMLRAVFPKGGCYEVHVLYQAEYEDTVAFDVKLLDPAAPGGVVSVSFEGRGWGFG